MSSWRQESRLARLERSVRDSWTGAPGPGLRLTSVAYGFVHDVRDLLYESGILPSRRLPLPVISVGGLTAGGSGKTPVSAALAAWLLKGGCRPAVVTAGVPDEAAVQRLLNPDVMVLDDRNRRAAVQRAAADGAGSIVLDSGFQHRKIRSDLQVLCVDEFSASLPERRRLPAGPFRERWSALARADAIVLVRREAAVGSGSIDDPRGSVQRSVRTRLEELQRWAPRALVLDCMLRPTGLQPANLLAERRRPGDNSVAVAGVMWPEPFFRAVEGLNMSVGRKLAFRDHEPFGPDPLDSIRASSGDGVICTLKDAVKLGPLLADELPVWYLEEEPVWGEGERRLRSGTLRTGSGGASSGRLDWHRGDKT
jgi:tetraacyldisaccharide 4'-kinase